MINSLTCTTAGKASSREEKRAEGESKEEARMQSRTAGAAAEGMIEKLSRSEATWKETAADGACGRPRNSMVLLHFADQGGEWSSW